MKKMTMFFASLSLSLLLLAPVTLAGENHSGYAPPEPPGGGISLPGKGNPVIPLLVFLLNLERVVPVV